MKSFCLPDRFVPDRKRAPHRCDSLFGKFRRQFRLDAKALRADRDGFQDFGACELVTGFHVGQIQVGKKIGEQGQQPIACRVPKEQHSPIVAGQETRPVDHIGVAVEDRLQQPRVFRGAVLQIRVLEYDIIAGRNLDPCAQRGPFALVDGVANDLKCRGRAPRSAICSRIRLVPSEEPSSTMMTSLSNAFGQRGRHDFVDDLFNRIFLIEYGDDNGQYTGRDARFCVSTLIGGGNPLGATVLDEHRGRRCALCDQRGARRGSHIA